MNIEQIKLLGISYLMRRLPVQLRGKTRIARYLLNKSLEKKDIL